MPTNLPVTLQIKGGCTPVPFTIPSTSVTVTLVTVIAVGGNPVYDLINNPFIGVDGYINYNQSSMDYHFFSNELIPRTFPITLCSGLFNTCTTAAVNVLTAKYTGGPTAFNYSLPFPIGTPAKYVNVITLTPGTVADWTTTVPTGCSPFVPCIPKGQRVLTPDGLKAIELIQTGDLITTDDNRQVAVVVNEFFVPIATECNAPIFIPANTFADGLPVNDISLSPNHMMMIKPGVWDLPSNLYINFNTITRTNLGEQIMYYNFQTPNFLTDNIVVEGTPVEAYGINFREQYPGERQYYNYSEEQGGYIRITMDDVVVV